MRGIQYADLYKIFEVDYKISADRNLLELLVAGFVFLIVALNHEAVEVIILHPFDVFVRILGSVASPRQACLVN